MKNIPVDYIPIELCHEAKNFIEEITSDVDIFNQFRSINQNLNEEALKFATWWDFKKYLENRHSLILLYENITAIYEKIGSYDVMDGFYQLQMKMVLLYRLLKEHGMINE